MAPGSSPHPVELRIQALALMTAGHEMRSIEQTLKISIRTLQSIRKKALDRGFNPQTDPRIRREYVEDGKRSGRPKQITPVQESNTLASITEDRSGRETSSEIFAYEAGISHASVLQILRCHGLLIYCETMETWTNRSDKKRVVSPCFKASLLDNGGLEMGSARGQASGSTRWTAGPEMAGWTRRRKEGGRLGLLQSWADNETILWLGTILLQP